MRIILYFLLFYASTAIKYWRTHITTLQNKYHWKLA